MSCLPASSRSATSDSWRIETVERHSRCAGYISERPLPYQRLCLEKQQQSPLHRSLPTMQTGHLARYRPAHGARAPHMDNSSCRLSNQLVLNSIMLTRRLIRIYTAADIPSVSAVVCPHAAFNAHTETASAAYCKSPYPHYPARATLPPANFYRGALSIRHYGFIASYK
jgi:hypothetical protein